MNDNSENERIWIITKRLNEKLTNESLLNIKQMNWKKIRMRPALAVRGRGEEISPPPSFR